MLLRYAAVGLLGCATIAASPQIAATGMPPEVLLVQAQPPAQPQNVEANIASLHQRLQITPAQEAQFNAVANMRLFTDMTVDGVKCFPDGMRADVTGNLWCSSNAPLGYAGVLVFNPAGKLIGRVRLPEVCANLCFGGPKRDRLFMAASQSLYMLQVATQGAAPG